MTHGLRTCRQEEPRCHLGLECLSGGLRGVQVRERTVDSPTGFGAEGGGAVPTPLGSSSLTAIEHRSSWCHS